MKNYINSINRYRIPMLMMLVALFLTTTLFGQIDCTNIQEWDAGKVYAAGGTQVKYENKVYENKYWTQGDNPAQSGEWGAWRYINDCIVTNPPTADLTAPSNGAVFAVNTPITLTATAADSDGTVQSVEFFANNVSVGVSAGPTYSVSWTPATVADYALKAVATDNDGAKGESSVVNIVVNSDGNIPPVVNMTAPVSGTKYDSGVLSIDLAASASDSDGSVVSVEFFNGGVSVGTDATSPYTASIANPADGTYSLTAVATDDKGATTTSQTVVVTVGVVNTKKQVIGYITQWDAWKDTKAGVPSQGAYTHLNVDMSKYTILNYSFFGVASDGSLHSGDFRNKQIYMDGVSQAPADLFFTDTYSSWDVFIMFGETEQITHVNADVVTRATAQGFVVTEGATTWSHPAWKAYDQPLPLPLHTEGGAPGLLELAHQNGVKVMASIGGWSMCKHFPEMAADPVKRQRFIDDCVVLINLGFDGIDLDWEYPGPFSGMNFTGTEADFTNFAILIEEIRAAIGPDKLITSAMSAAPNKLQGFDWPRVANTMDYFNMMTYDFNGGWSNIAGHNSPLYPYTGAEADFSWERTLQALDQLGVPRSKINMGIPFYGRGVICNGTAALNAPTVKRDETIQPDGPISTCADYVNWPKEVYDGTPNYSFIKQKTGLGTTGGWTRHWDNEAKVPYLTNGTYFLSYDDLESIELKSQYIMNNQLAGTIVWTVYGDLEFGGTVTNHGIKLKSWSNMSHELIDKVTQVFGNNNINELPTATVTAPAEGSTFPEGTAITVSASAVDTDGTITSVEFFANGTSIGVDNTYPYSVDWTPAAGGNYALVATATDNNNGQGSSPAVNIVVEVEVPVLTTINVSPSTATVGVNLTQQFAAEGLDQNGNVMSGIAFAWSATAGTVDANGLFTAGAAAGNATVTATSGSVSGSASVTVTVDIPVLTSIVVTPDNAIIDINGTQQFAAQGYDQNNNPIAANVAWTTTGGSIDANGLFTGSVDGLFTVTATDGAVSGSASITVNPAGGCTAPQYVQNGGYVAGSLVQNNGVEYECKPYPFSGWCNGQAWAYEPGAGAYWSDAWTEVGPCLAVKGASAVESLISDEIKVYPNPFSSVAVVELNVSEDTYAEFKVYSTSGKQVMSVINRHLEKGVHTVELDASELPSGMYIYKVQLNDRVISGNLLKK